MLVAAGGDVNTVDNLVRQMDGGVDFCEHVCASVSAGWVCGC